MWEYRPLVWCDHPPRERRAVAICTRLWWLAPARTPRETAAQLWRAATLRDLWGRMGKVKVGRVQKRPLLRQPPLVWLTRRAGAPTGCVADPPDHKEPVSDIYLGILCLHPASHGRVDPY